MDTDKSNYTMFSATKLRLNRKAEKLFVILEYYQME